MVTRYQRQSPSYLLGTVSRAPAAAPSVVYATDMVPNVNIGYKNVIITIFVITIISLI